MRKALVILLLALVAGCSAGTVQQVECDLGLNCTPTPAVTPAVTP